MAGPLEPLTHLQALKPLVHHLCLLLKFHILNDEGAHILFAKEGGKMNRQPQGQKQKGG